jgi:hypothetical protein
MHTVQNTTNTCCQGLNATSDTTTTTHKSDSRPAASSAGIVAGGCIRPEWQIPPNVIWKPSPKIPHGGCFPPPCHLPKPPTCRPKINLEDLLREQGGCFPKPVDIRPMPKWFKRLPKLCDFPSFMPRFRMPRLRLGRLRSRLPRRPRLLHRAPGSWFRPQFARLVPLDGSRDASIKRPTTMSQRSF